MGQLRQFYTHLPHVVYHGILYAILCTAYMHLSKWLSIYLPFLASVYCAADMQCIIGCVGASVHPSAMGVEPSKVRLNYSSIARLHPWSHVDGSVLPFIHGSPWLPIYYVTYVMFIYLQ